MALRIRPMEKRDIERVYEIEVQSFRTPWSKASLMGELKNRVARYLLLEEDGIVAAYGGMWVLYEESHMTNIAVAPEYRGRGYGRILFFVMMAEAQKRGASQMTLEVRETNTVAQNLYYSLDFEKQGYRKRYYEDTGEGAYLLWNRDIAATVAKNACIQEKYALK